MTPSAHLRSRRFTRFAVPVLAAMVLLALPDTVLAADTTAPTAPTNVAASSTTQTSATLNWTASTDNIGVAGYHVYKDGTHVGTVYNGGSPPATTYAITGLTCGISYAIQIVAADASSNWTVSSTLTLTTASCSGAPTVTITAPASGSSSSATSASVAFTTTGSPTSITCKLDAGSASACTSPKTYSSLAAGSHTVTVTATNASGSASTTTTFTVVDNTAPTAPTNVAASSTTQTSATLNWTASTDNIGVAGYHVYKDGTYVGTVYNGGSPPATTYAITGLTCGTSYAIQIVAADASSNWTVSSTLTLTTASCASPPTVTVTSPALDATIDSTSASVAFTTTNSPTSTTCALDSGTPTACTSPKAYSDLDEGAHIVTVSVSNAAGSDSAAISFTVDSIDPTVSITSPTEGAMTAADLDVAVTTDGTGTTVTDTTCQLDSETSAPCTSPQSYPALTPGAHSVTIEATDEAGNTGSDTVNFTVAAPPTVTVTSPALDATIDSTSASVAFTTTNSPTSTTCALDSGTPTACASPQSYSYLSEGDHFVTVTVENAAGSDTAFAVFFVDSIDPTVSITSPTEGATTGPDVDVNLTLDGTGTRIPTLTCQLDGGIAAPCSSYPLPSYTALTPGAHSVTIEATDEAGNTGSDTVNFTVAAPPTVTVTSPALDATIDSTSASVAFTTTNSPTSTTCALDSGTPTACTSPKAYSDLDEGAHIVTVTVSNAAGSDSAVASFTVDLGVTITAPADTEILNAPPSVTNDPVASISFGAVPAGQADSFECAIDAGSYSACISPWTVPQSLSEGRHSISVRSVNQFGPDATPAIAEFEVDTTPPDTAVIVSPLSGSQFAVGDLSVEFSEDGVSSYFCSLDGAVPETCTSPYQLANVQPGTHDIQVIAVDSAGNSASAVTQFIVENTNPGLDTHFNTAPSNLLPVGGAATLDFASTTPGSFFECRLGTEMYQPCSPPVTFTDLPADEYSYSMRAIDTSGAKDGTPLVHRFTIDGAPPAITFTGLPSTPARESGGQIEFDADEEATFECSFDSAAFAGCESPFTVPTGLSEGEHVLDVRATDAVGNVTDPAEEVSLEIDTSGPETLARPENFTAGGDVDGSDIRVWLGPELQDFYPYAEQFDYECALDDDAFTPCIRGYNFLDDTALSVGSLGATASPGLHVLMVRAVDEAGNVDATPVEIELNAVSTAAPGAVSVEIDRGPANGSAVNSGDIRFSFTASDGAQVNCDLENPASGVAVAFDPCQSPLDLSSLSDGKYRFSVTASDGQTGQSDIDVRDFEVDTTPPTVVAFGAETADSGENATNGSVVVNSTRFGAAFGTSDYSPAKILCAVDGGPFSECTSSAPTFGIAEEWMSATASIHTISAKAIDAAGNESVAATSLTVIVDPEHQSGYSFELDTVVMAPSAPNLFNGEVSSTADLEFDVASVFASYPEWPSGNRIDCKIDDGDFQSCPRRFKLPTLSNGAHTFTAAAYDRFGNPDPTPFVGHFEIAAPGSDADAFFTSAPPAVTNSLSHAVEFDSSTPVDGFQCKLNSSSWRPCSSPYLLRLPSDSSDGEFEISVRSVANGRASAATASATMLLDRTAPELSISGPDPAQPSASSAVAFEFSGSGSAEFECALDGGSFAECPATTTFTGLADGDHVVAARGIDEAENRSAIGFHEFSIQAGAGQFQDLLAPDTYVISGPEDQAILNSSVVSFSLGASKPATYDCTLDGTPLVGCFQGEADITAGDGTHMFTATASDAMGNEDPSPVSRQFIVDTIAPDAPSIATSLPEVTSDASLSLDFSSDPAAATECKLDSGPWESCESPYGADNVGDGVHHFVVRSIDDASNVSPEGRVDWKVDTSKPAPPVNLSVVEPIEGKAYVRWDSPQFAMYGDGPDFSGYTVRMCTSPEDSVAAVADCDARGTQAGIGEQAKLGWGQWQDLPTSASRSGEFDIGDFPTADAFGNPVTSEKANSVAFEIKSRNKAGTLSNAAVVAQNRSATTRPKISLTGGTYVDLADEWIGDDTIITAAIDAHDGGSGLLRGGFACKPEEVPGGGGALTDCASDPTENVGTTGLTKLSEKSFTCDISVPGDPIGVLRCSEQIQDTLEFSTASLSELTLPQLYVWVEDASHDITVEPLEASLSVDRTPPAPPEVSDLLVEDGILVAEWATEGDDSSDVPESHPGSGVAAFNVRYRVGGGAWIGPETVDAADAWRFSKDIDVSDGDTVEVRVDATDAVGLSTEGAPSSTTATVTAPDEVDDQIYPGLSTDLFPSDDETATDVTAGWRSETGDVVNHVRVTAQVFDSADESLTTPLQTRTKDCYETDVCEMDASLPYVVGSFRVAATAYSITGSNQTTLATDVSTPTDFPDLSQSQGGPSGATGEADSSADDGSGFGDFDDANNNLGADEPADGGQDTASIAKAASCNYDWTSPDKSFNPLRKLKKGHKLLQKRCRYGVKVGLESKYSKSKVELAKQYGVADNYIKRAYFSSRSSVNYMAKTDSKIYKKFNRTKLHQGAWPLYDSFGNVRAYFKQRWSKHKKRGYYYIYEADAAGGKASLQIKAKATDTAIKVQGLNCFAGSTPKLPALAGFDLSKKGQRVRTRLFVSRSALPKSMSKAILRQKHGISCSGSSKVNAGEFPLRDPLIPERGTENAPRTLRYRQATGTAYTMATYGPTSSGTIYLNANTTQVKGGGMARAVIPLLSTTKVAVVGYTDYCDRNAVTLTYEIADDIPNGAQVNPKTLKSDPENMKRANGLQWAFVRVVSASGYDPAHAKKRIYGWIPVRALGADGAQVNLPFGDIYKCAPEAPAN